MDSTKPDRAARPAPEPEIEITEAMIEAGLGPLLRFSRERDLPEESVVEIFRAMLFARHGKSFG